MLVGGYFFQAGMPEGKQKEKKRNKRAVPARFPGCPNDSSLYDIRSLLSVVTVHTCAHLLDVIRRNVFVVAHHLVNDSIRSQFDDTVGHRFDKLVVV